MNRQYYLKLVNNSNWRSDKRGMNRHLITWPTQGWQLGQYFLKLASFISALFLKTRILYISPTNVALDRWNLAYAFTTSATQVLLRCQRLTIPCRPGLGDRIDICYATRCIDYMSMALTSSLTGMHFFTLEQYYFVGDLHPPVNPLCSFPPVFAAPRHPSIPAGGISSSSETNASWCFPRK